MDQAIPSPPSPPSDLVPRGRGRRFWRGILAEYALREDELELLGEAARMLDLLDVLRAAGSPVLIDGRMNPAITEARLTRQELRRTLGGLCLPDLAGEGEEPAAEPRSIRTARARRAAKARWDRGA